jgi:hypothetical protein
MWQFADHIFFGSNMAFRSLKYRYLRNHGNAGGLGSRERMVGQGGTGM